MNSGIVILFVAIAITFLLLWQFRTHWIYLCRISLLGLLFLGLVPILAVSVARGLLIGAFDLDTLGSAIVGFLLFFVAWAIIATSELVLQLGEVRLGVKVPQFGKGVYIVRAILIFVACAINCVVVVTATEGPKLEVACGLMLGFGVAVTMFVVIQIWEARGNGILDFSKPGTLTVLMHWVLAQILQPRVKGPSDATTPVSGFVLKFGLHEIFVPGWLGRGYLQQTERGAVLLSDHMRAAVALVVFAAIYLCFAVLEITRNHFTRVVLSFAFACNFHLAGFRRFLFPRLLPCPNINPNHRLDLAFLSYSEFGPFLSRLAG